MKQLKDNVRSPMGVHARLILADQHCYKCYNVPVVTRLDLISGRGSNFCFVVFHIMSLMTVCKQRLLFYTTEKFESIEFFNYYQQRFVASAEETAQLANINAAFGRS